MSRSNVTPKDLNPMLDAIRRFAVLALHFFARVTEAR